MTTVTAVRPVVPAPAPVERVERIPRHRIRRFDGQPRTYFDPVLLRELADSIEEVGLLQPILVKPITDDPDHDYELVDGERRWLACGLAKVVLIRAFIVEPKDVADQFVKSVVSNFGRVNHTPIETARAVKILYESEEMKDLGATEKIQRIARMCARSVPWAYQHLALLRLVPSVIARMEPTVPKEKRLDFAIALYMTRLHPDLQVRIAEEVVERNLNIKEARLLVRRIAEEHGSTAGHTDRKRPPSDDYRILDRLLSTFLKQIGSFQQLSVEALRVLFRRRNETDRDQVIFYIDRIIEKLQDLREKIAQK